VDLSEDYDLELMKRFYRELIEPHMLVNPSAPLCIHREADRI
jgi:hypothetical protein